MNTRALLATVAAPLVLAPLTLLGPAASAHTTILIAAQHDISHGEVGPLELEEGGPASDGTVVFSNLDPVAHTIEVRDGVGALVRTFTIDSGAQRTESGFGRGSYSFEDPAVVTVHGHFRVTGSH